MLLLLEGQRRDDGDDGEVHFSSKSPLEIEANGPQVNACNSDQTAAL
jgi:hypothetical protein